MKLSMLKILMVVALLSLAACQSLPISPVKDSKEDVTAEQELIRQGIELHELGEFGRAEQRYLQVLAVNPDNAFAMYELAYALVAQRKHDEALRWADKALQYRSSSRPELLVLKANLLDGAGKSAKAIELYQQGLKEFPDYSGLYYNYGITLLNQRKIDNAVSQLEANLQLRPDHASGHLALGMAFAEQSRRTEAILALLRFLSIEPDSERSGNVLGELRSLMSRGISVEKDESGKPKISVGPGAFGASTNDLGLALMASLFTIDENEEKRHSQLSMIISMLAEPKQPIKANEMVKAHYLDFLKAIYNNKHQQTFVYYVEQSRSDQAKKWLAEHAPEKGLFEVFSRQQLDMLRPAGK